MNISELPIDKLKLCIENEKRRLADIVETYNKEYDEYSRWLSQVDEKKEERESHFNSLTKSLVGAQEFIKECETRLTKLQNGEISESN